MADTKISALSDGSPAVSTDELVIARSGSNYKLPVSTVKVIGGMELVYRYTVAGTDKASIDTGADTADAGSNVWTGGDLLEVCWSIRTDDGAALALVNVTVNNDGSSIYDRQTINTNNATTAAGTALAGANWQIQVHGSGGSASYVGVARLLMPNFAGTTFWKTFEVTDGASDATAGNNSVQQSILGYRSTSAITRLKVAATGTQKLKVGSQLLIYKRRNA